MDKKVEILKNFMRAGEWDKALALAAKWPRLGVHKEAIVLGHEARTHRDMYRQLGHDPDVLIAEGIKALKARYPL